MAISCGLCAAHYSRLRHGGDPGSDRPIGRSPTVRSWSPS